MEALIGQMLVDVHQRIRIVPAGLVLETVDVDVRITEGLRDLSEHVRDVPVQDGDTSAAAADTHIGIREVHGVMDITVVEVILYLLDRHHRTVVLGLLGGCAEMRQDDGPRHHRRLRIREVGHIGLYLPLVQCFRHIIVIDQHIAGEIQDADAVLHARDGILVDHALRTVDGWYMDRDIVALIVDFIENRRVMHLLGEIPGRLHGKVRIIAIDLHAEVNGGIGDEYADRTEADNAEGLALDLTAGEVLLRLLGILLDGRNIGMLPDPLITADDVTARQHQTRDHQLLHGICIGTRGVEDDDALLSTAVERDVVDAGTGTSDGTECRREVHRLHIGGAHQHTGGVVDLVDQSVTLPETSGSDTADII